jgi:TorA maturation chaperone TorD
VAGFASDRTKYAQAAALVPKIASRYHIDKVANEYLRLFIGDGRLARAQTRGPGGSSASASHH